MTLEVSTDGTRLAAQMTSPITQVLRSVVTALVDGGVKQQFLTALVEAWTALIAAGC